MRWNMTAECISLVILSITWIYIRQSKWLPTLKNQLFQWCFFITFLSMLSNIVSSVFNSYPGVIPNFLGLLGTNFYYLIMPWLGFTYFYYVNAVLYEGQRPIPKFFYMFTVPSVLYSLVILFNPLTQWFSGGSMGAQYFRYPYLVIMYFLFYTYCFGSVLVVILNIQKNRHSRVCILLVFPIAVIFGMEIESFFSGLILTGTASTCSLLIICLYLQNRQESLDDLLKIPNYQAFYHTVSLHLKKKRMVPFTVLVVSLRDFKRINDTYGRNQGDAFLRLVCSFLKEAGYPVYRFRGDEFSVFFKGLLEEEVSSYITSLQKRMEQAWRVGNYSCMIDIGIAGVRYPESAIDLEGILNAMEYSVLKAKTANHKGVCWGTPAMLEEMHRKYKVIDVLKDALKNDGFDVFYQLIFDSQKEEFSVIEARLRLRASEMGSLTPTEMIPIAEETGLIIPITYQMLNQVCRFVKVLLSEGVELKGVGVKFSMMMFTQENLYEEICRIIDSHKVPYEVICIEVTESIFCQRAKNIETFLSRIREKGVKIGMDDFGASYSNLSSIMNLSLDFIKVDKGLFWEAMKKEQSSLMLKCLVKAIEEMGFFVVLEGIETMVQNNYAKECGCRYIQGFLYSKPMEQKQAFLQLTRESHN